MAGALETAARALDELGFFSKALEEAKGAKMKSGTPQQWMNVLKKQGVKPAELEATGFTNMLGEQPNAQLAKDDVVKFLTDNRVKLAEPTGRKVDVEAMRRQRDDLTERSNAAYRAYTDFVESAPNPREAAQSQQAMDLYRQHTDLQRQRQRLTDQIMDGGGATKFEQYSLPGGSNYTEAKLQLAPRTLTEQERRAAAIEYYNQMRRGPGEVPFEERSPAYQNDLMDLMTVGRGTPRFNSSHWDEPDVVSHYRTKDRTGPNGERVLHIDEVQSDWGQAGRDQGFRDPEAPKRVAELRKQLEAATKERNDLHRDLTEYLKTNHPEPKFDPFDRKLFDPKKDDEIWAARQSAMDADPEVRARQDALHAAQDRYRPINEAYIQAQKAASNGTVQPGPFVTDTKDWTDLTLKRALLRAQQEGYDAVALTPGVEQANRYDLSEQVGKISYIPSEGNLRIYGPDGGVIHDAEGIEPHQLPGMIGKDNAERLMQNRQQGAWGYVHQIEPEDMTWGGEGMKAFYDRMVPDRLMSLARKLDPEARLESMPAGRRLGMTWADEMRGPERVVHENLPNGEARDVGRFPNLDAAEDYVQANHWPRGGEIPQLPMLRLTPRMKEQLKQGLPLFVGAPAVAGGALSALDRGQAPAGNEFARGGLAQARNDANKTAYRASTWSPERYLDTAGDRGLVPNYDALVATRPVGVDELIARRNERRGYADGGEVEGWGGVDPWGGSAGLDAAIAQGLADIRSMESAQAGTGNYGGFGGLGQSWADMPSNDPMDPRNPMNWDNTGMSIDPWGGKVGDAIAQGQADLAAMGYGGGNDQPAPEFDTTEVTPPADTTRTALGFDAFSPSPLASMAVDLTPPQTSYAGTVPAEYVSPDQTLSGPAPMSGMSTMAGLAAPMGLGFDLAPAQQEQDRERNRAQAFSDVYDPSAPRGLAADMELRGLADRTVAQEKMREAILAEAGNQSIEGKYGVANAIANRADIGFNPGRMGDKTLTGDIGIYNQITAPNQFSYLNSAPQMRENLAAIRSDIRNMTPDSTEAWDIAGRVLSGQVPDNTYGAVNYRNAEVATDKSGYHDRTEARGKVDIGDHTFSGLGSSSRAPYGDITSGRSASISDDPSTFLGYSPSSFAPDDMLASMSSPTMNRPSMTFDQVAPGILGSGLGFSPFGYAGTSNFGPAMGTIDPVRGTQTYGSLPGGLPSFVADDMARAYDPYAFGQVVGSTFGASQPSGQMINGRPVDSYGFAGPAVAADSPAPRAPGYENPPIDVPTLPEPAPVPENEPSSPSRSRTMNEKIAGLMGQTESRRAIDPLTRQVYDPVTGYTYPVDPVTTGKVIDGVIGIGVPIFGQLNGLSRLLGGPSVGGVMAQGAPGGWDNPTSSYGADRAYGNAGADSRDPQYLSPTPSSPIPAPAPTPATSTTPPTDPAAYLAYLRRRYMGEDADPKTYGMRPMRSYFSYE